MHMTPIRLRMCTICAVWVFDKPRETGAPRQYPAGQQLRVGATVASLSDDARLVR